LGSDEELLAQLGNKHELNRSWSGFSNFAISFSIISILAGWFTTFLSGWNGGGPAAIAWGWPILATLIMCIGLCLAEMVSAYPTSGGICWWASKLGGRKAGYYTGWLNLIGLLAIVASVVYGCATFFDLTFSFLWPSHVAGNLDTVFLYFIIILAIAGAVNIFSSHLLAMVNNVSLWWHVFGAAVVLILIVIPHHHASASMVFTSTVNNTGFFSDKTHGFGFLIVVLPIGALLTQHTITNVGGRDPHGHRGAEGAVRPRERTDPVVIRSTGPANPGHCRSPDPTA
jgi:amino acid transporter